MAKIKALSPCPRGVKGTIAIPGDKSISHRSIMFSALGSTPVRITNFLHAADCLSTAEAMRALGARVIFESDTELIVTGHGLHGLVEPKTILDAGNSGTTLRLLLGMLAPQKFLTTFTGDASLHRRPMGRVVKPLMKMGARIFGREENTKLPLTIVPMKEQIHAMTYESPIASAQVKSAVLLAGLFASGVTRVTEPFRSRDHTEKMLAAFGVKLDIDERSVAVHPPKEMYAPKAIEVPGDISSAAYWLVLGSILPDSELLLTNVGINPTRTGILDVLTAMGADITLENERTSGGEPAADMRVKAANLKRTSFGAEIIPRLIDEIPIIAVAALFAQGDTVITGAGELRVKETDRLAAIEKEFNKIAPGAVETQEDGLIIHGGQKLSKARCFSYDDHRIAMSLAILGLAGAGVEIEEPECVRISYPAFYDILESIR